MLVLRPKPRSTMKKKDHSPEQIITKLRKVEALTAQGQTIAEAVKHADIESTSRQNLASLFQQDHTTRRRKGLSGDTNQVDSRWQA